MFRNKENNGSSSLKDIYESARLKYMPNNVKYLLIAEAPPDDINRFFYFENVPEKDFLFMGIIQTLYPKLKSAYKNNGRKSMDKELLLKKFQSEGFYLIDLSPLPLIFGQGSLDSLVPDLIERIGNIVESESKIILIKANVYDLAYDTLNLIFDQSVVDKKIPFPSTGQQANFRTKFQEALKVARYYR